MKKKLNRCYTCGGYGKITEGHLVLKIGPIRVMKDKTIECPRCFGQKEIFMTNSEFDEIERTIH